HPSDHRRLGRGSSAAPPTGAADSPPNKICRGPNPVILIKMPAPETMKRPSLLLVLCLALAGCHWFPESMFDLADDSRLPKWFTMPAGRSRSDIRVELYYYSDGEVEFFLENKYGITISKVKGQRASMQPLTMSGDPRDHPSFEFITVDGVS